MFYLAIISSSFRKSSLEELGKIAEFRIVDQFVTSLVIESGEEEFAEKLLRSDPVFVYNIFPLGRVSDIEASDYRNSIYEAVLPVLPRKGSVKIECFDVNCKTEYSAKDIEVYIGQRMEEDGYDVSILDPDYLVYPVLINRRAYVGVLKYGDMEKKFINPERHYHQFSKEAISRSELKLIQAFDDFETGGRGIALDLGAAPGGWSDFLAKSGYKVIAVDNGELDYGALEKRGFRVKVAEGGKALQDDLRENDIVHIKSNAKNVSELDGIKVDLIVNDMNMEPSDSVAVLLPFLEIASKNAELIMTIKCIDRKAEKFIAKAKKALGGHFKITGLRVLPSNRQELTLHAVSI